MRILIVDDNELLAESYTRSFTRRGHMVNHVASLSALKHHLNLLETVINPPDVILTDRHLPDGDGWDFCDKLPKRQRVVFMSGKPAITPRKYYTKGLDDLCKLFELVEKG